MATGATMHRFEISLADSDRGVYEELDLRVARHSSESASFLLVRVLAYCLEWAEGIQFSKGGVSDNEEPALSVWDLTGQRLVWIDVGAPSGERLHRASKATARVVLYTDRRLDLLRTSVAGVRIHRSEALLVTAFPRTFLADLEATLDRTNRWTLSVGDGHLYTTVGERTFDTAISPVPLAES